MAWDLLCIWSRCEEMWSFVLDMMRKIYESPRVVGSVTMRLLPVQRNTSVAERFLRAYISITNRLREMF